MELDYHIIGSGSSGNAVRIENIMFDCGIPFAKMKDDLYKVDYLLITHEHKDHVNRATLKNITKKFPNIRIFSTYRVARLDDNIVAINTDYLPIWLGDVEMWAVEVPHDVLTYGYLIRKDDFTYIYATDLHDCSSLNKLLDELNVNLDYVFLEANYDPEKLKAIGNEWRGQYNPYIDSSSRHLSRDDCLAFYARNRKEGGKLIELHKSKRFY